MQAIELVIESGVFILKTDRKSAQNKATSSTTLARAILFSLFTTEALLSCTLAGSKKKTGTDDDKEQKGLPIEAVTALLGTKINKNMNKCRDCNTLIEIQIQRFLALISQACDYLVYKKIFWSYSIEEK